jgi:membrane protein DedA with SNARE-associated domain
MDLMAMIENAMTSPVNYLAILAPSESVVIAAAVFAVSGIPSLPLIIVLAALGAFVGDHIGHLIGRLLRERRPGGRLVRAADRIAPHLHRRGESNPTLGLAVGLGLALSITALGELVRYVLRRRRAATAAG